MFVKRQLKNGRYYYSVVESYKPKDKKHPTSRVIVPLGHESSPARAYQKQLQIYLEAADRLTRLERVLSVIPGAEYHGSR